MTLQLLCFLGCVAFLYFAKSIFIPLILSIFLYFLLDPIVSRLESKCVPRAMLSLGMVLVSVGAVLLCVWLTYLTSAEIALHIPEYSEKIRHISSLFTGKLDNVIKMSGQLVHDINKEPIQKVEVVHSMGDITGFVFKGIDSVSGVMGIGFIIPILTFLFLIEKSKLSEKLKLFSFFSEMGRDFFMKMSQVVHGFFIGNLIAGFASAILFFILFAFIGLNNNVALSIGSGFSNLVPIVGPFLSVVFPIAQGLLQFESIFPFLMIASSSILVHLLIGNLLLPKLMGSRVDLNIVAATIGMLFWGWLWGPMGIFLGVPLTAVIRVICSYSDKTKVIEVALSESKEKYATSIVVVKSLKAESLKILKILRVGEKLR